MEEDDKEPEPEEKTQTQTPPGTGLSFTALAAPYKDNAQCYYCQKVFLTKYVLFARRKTLKVCSHVLKQPVKCHVKVSLTLSMLMASEWDYNV